MTEHLRPRRVATVSFGTLLLCLTGAGTALAASGPTPDASFTSVLPSPGATVGASLLPSPTPLPTSLSTVTSTLQGATGASSPAPTPTAAPVPAGAATGGAPTGTSAGAGTVGHPQARTPARPSRAGSGAHGGTGTPSGAALPPPGSLAAGAARVAALDAFAGQVPTIAPQRAQLMAAGQSPALAPAPQAAFGGWGGQDPNVPRGLLVGLATMVVGGLAAGHLKMAQNRLVHLGAAPPRYRPTHRA